MFIEKTRFWRSQVLQRVRHNLALIPEELVERDYQTDSLLHKPFARKKFRTAGLLPKAVVLELDDAFRNVFGFPHVAAVSQGRVAEAMCARLLVRNGYVIPSSALFPTTHIHYQLNGGIPVEAMTEAAYDPSSEDPFKGNLDVALVEKIIDQNHPRWCPFICVEPCNNATGGHPVSMDNMRRIRALADKKGVKVVLDASRMVENAFHIRERESGFAGKPVLDIIREFCSYADHCSLSATKDFPTPIGGFFATRDEKLYHEAMDFIVGFGSGLSHDGREALAGALAKPEDAFLLVAEKMALVKRMHEGLRETLPLVGPAGGHAVYVDMNRFDTGVPADLHPDKAFLHYLYQEYGVRAAENMPSPKQKERGIRLVRFAVPVIHQDKDSVEATIRDVKKAVSEKTRYSGLKKTGEPPGITGPMRAYYAPGKISR